MKPAPEIGRLLSIGQVREMLSCGRDKVYALRDRGELEFVKLDHRTRITERSVKRYLHELVKNHTVAARTKSSEVA